MKVLFSCFHETYKIHFAVKNLSAYLNPTCKVKFFSVMAYVNVCDPPETVKGMKVLDKDAFKKIVNFPHLIVENNKIRQMNSILKEYCSKYKSLNSHKNVNEDCKKIFLNPELINTWDSFDDKTKELLKTLNIAESNFGQTSVELNYDDWPVNAILKAILPSEDIRFSGFSVIGHILQLNLKNDLLPFKDLIGQVLLDKIPLIKTVVCKKNYINNTYRNLDMEVVCGEQNFITLLKENGCKFELDFSKVYYNPRLGTERARIVNMLNAKDVLFDISAGVGPFSIPAALKQCKVFANDLNPDSVKWLNHNISLNKKSKEFIKTFNKDGGNFILSDVKENLIKIWKDEYFNGKIFAIMNLPSLSLTFLKYFNGLVSSDEVKNLDLKKIKKCLPIIHFYFFVTKNENLTEFVEKQSEISFKNIEHTISYVRIISNSKKMCRISFEMPFDYLMAGSKIENLDNGEPLAKKVCKN